MNIDYEAIGRRIRTRRIQKAMTQEQLAALIEREPAYLSRIEHGNQKPSLDTLLRKYSAAMSDVNMVAVQNMIPSAKRLLTRRNKAAIIQTNNKFCGRRLMNIDWNAKGYQKDFAFVPKYGEAVLDLIDAAPGALAVDLGCGNGGLTGKLIERGYRVVGVDASAPMLALAKERYPDTTFLQADACTFQLPEQADVIFSNAVLHWIDAAKQNELIANIASQLKPGGQLVCEFGGKGCAETVHAVLEKSLRPMG
jgi:cheR methyltransferase, SAM binding domain